MSEIHGFKERHVAQTLKDFALEREASAVQDTSNGVGVGLDRNTSPYWVVPKGTIPAATTNAKPGIGKAYVLYLDKNAVPPELKRRQRGDGEGDLEVDISNYMYLTFVEDTSLTPKIRAERDVFGDLAIQPSGLGRLHCKLPSEWTTAQATKAACPVIRSVDGMTYPATVTIKNIASVINSGSYINAGPIDSIVLVSYDPVTNEYIGESVECPTS